MRKLKLFFACLLMAVLSIGQMWGADPAAVGTTLFSENFGSYSANDVPSGSVSAATGRVVYGNGSVTYSVTNGGSTTKIYAETSAGGTSPEILIGKSSGTLTIAGIPSGGAQAITVSYYQNKQKLKVESTTTGYSGSKDEKPSSVGANSVDITIADGAAETFTLVFTCTGSSNVRVDNILVTVKTAGEGAAPVTPTCATPTFDPEDGETFTEDIDVEIAAESGTTIYYTTDGTKPTTSSSVYSSALNFTETTTLKAIAAKEGSNNSDVATATYTKVEPYSGSILEIVKGDFTTASYDANNGDHEKSGITFTTNKVYQSGGGIQFQKTNGLLYNKTDLGEIAKIEITTVSGKANNLVVYSGTTENPTSGAVTGSTSGSVTTYTFASGNGYFAIKCNSTGASNVDPIKIYYSGAAILPAAGIEYAEADQKKLTKLGEAFTAPTLSNPNNLTVTYASSAESVAEVAANGAVTIKAAGVAVITASFAGSEQYEAGSASYTIGVTSHAGTEADPYVAADAKIAIDVMGTVENAYASGIVCNVATSTLPQDGYISFYFSADGTTTGQQIEAYKCFGLNSAPFEAVTDVETGATVVVTGNLKKYNSTYEFDQNCHLVSYTAPAAPKQHINNEQSDPYTVAQAITFAADGVTYDLDDYVYVQGVVYDVKSFNEGVMNIFIKDANAENQFELYKCAGINDGNATTPFEALTDVQVGNIVIGYGQLTVYNNMSELKQGNYLVDLQKPVTGIELDATAEVEEESTVNLTATILPSNATGTIAWSVVSGAAYASVENGVVSGIAAGEAVIRATVESTEIYAECTVTVTEKAAPVSYDYALVTDAAQLQDGLKVIIVAAEEDKAAGSAAATYRNVVDVERTTGGDYLILDSENMPTEFTLGVPAAGQYTFNDGDGYMYENAAKSVKVQADPFNWSITIGEGNVATIQATNELRYNSTSPRFTTYASGQQALQLYVKDDGKQAAGLAWSTNAVELTVGDEFTAPTLSNPNNLTVTIASNNTELATVEGGVVSLVENATGTAIITASYAGDDTYRAASVSYTITVNAAEPPAPATYDYALVTDAAQLQDGLKVIIVAAEADKAAGSAAATYREVVDVERTTNGDYLILDTENMPTEFTLGVPAAGQYTFNDGNGYMYENAAKSVKVQADPFNWSITIGEGNVATIQATNELRYNSTNPRFTTYASGQQALQLYIKDDGKQAAGLAWSTNAVELTVGDEFTAPTLSNPNNLTVTIASNNTELATVEGGVVSLVENATGTAIITASYAGDDTYRATSVSYTITVSEAVVPPTPLPDAEAKVIVVEYDGHFYAMSTTVKNGTGFVPIEVEKDGGKIIVKTDAEAAAIQWQMAVGESVATFQNGDNKYLACGSNSNTELALLDAQSEWAWDADANCYKQPGKDNKGRSFFYYYNDGNSIFRAYAVTNFNTEGYSGVPEFIAAENIEVHPDYGSYNRNGLTAGNYATICLPQAGTISGATLFDLEYFDEAASTLYLLAVNGNAMEAGRPYIFLPSETSIEVTYTSDASEDAGSFNGLVGSYTQETVTADAGNYILYNNAYYLVNSTAYVGANRAYIHMDDVPTEPSTPQVGQAPRRRVAMNVNGTNQATGFENIEASEKPMKLMINGQIYILRGEKMYDATGRLVK